MGAVKPTLALAFALKLRAVLSDTTAQLLPVRDIDSSAHHSSAFANKACASSSVSHRSGTQPNGHAIDFVRPQSRQIMGRRSYTEHAPSLSSEH